MKLGAAFEEADAAVPAEDAVVVAGGANFLGFGEAAQGFFDERKKNVRGVPGAKLGFGAALVEEAGVVVALVGVAQTLKNGEHFRIAVAGGAGELVGDGEAEHAAGELMVRINSEDIAADGFGFFRLVEITIQIDFGEGFRNAGFGNGF